MRPTTVVELAERSGVELPEGLRDGRYEFRDFRHFIDEFVAGIACLRELDDFRRIAYELAEDEAAEGVRYAEVMVSLPDHRGRFEDWDVVLDSVLEGLADGERDFGVVGRVIVDVVRGIDLGLSRRAMEVGVRHRDAGVVGIGVGGEERFGPEPYEEIFLAGIAGGLHSVPHAGENEGAASIRGAVRQLRAERIGHGIRILEDPELVAEVRERGIALDVCPTSNVMTRSVPSLEEHPLPAMLDAGLRVHARERRPHDVRLAARRRVRALSLGLRVRRRAPRRARPERRPGVVRAGRAEGGARGVDRRLDRALIVVVQRTPGPFPIDLRRSWTTVSAAARLCGWPVTAWRNGSRSSASSRIGVRAVTVAVRGESRSRAISPT